MKRKNFPGRKMIRKINANRDMSKPYTDKEIKLLESAENTRTKKRRS